MYECASIFKRMLAYLIDNFICSSIVIYIYIMISVDKPNYAIMHFVILVPVIYFTLMHSSSWQATIGQKILRIRLISLRGDGKISGWLAFDRTISQFLMPVASIALFLFTRDFGFPIEPVEVIVNIFRIVVLYWYAVALFNKENETVHDLIFKTRVVNVKSQ